MRINHNISALNTYRQLSTNNAATSSSLQRLSSGLRVNSAADDAAGLAISEKMRGQIRGLDQAGSNANDGISLIQTAEGALNETHSILQRMRELAVQSANDTNTDNDRAEIQKEINQLTSEINRISTDTQFNTMNLIDGSLATHVTVTEVGVNSVNVTAGSTVESGSYTVAVTNFVPGGDGHPASSVTVTGAYGSTRGTPDSGTEVFKYMTVDDDGVAADGWYDDVPSLVADMPGETGLTPTGTAYSGATITATASVTYIGPTAASVSTLQISGNNGNGLTASNDDILNDLSGYIPTAVSAPTTPGAATIKFMYRALGTNAWNATVNDVAVSSLSGKTTAELAGFGLNIGGGAPEHGTTISFTLTGAVLERPAADPAVSITQSLPTAPTDDSYDIAITNPAGGTTSPRNFEFDFADSYTDTTFPIDVDADNALIFHIGANSGQHTLLSMKDMSAKSLGVDKLDLTSQKGADEAISTIDDAIVIVSAQRAGLGAMQNRLEHTINNVGTTSENLSASESQIRDADMAEEMMEYTKNNILSQAAQSMLAQANQQPQQVLQLLQG